MFTLVSFVCCLALFWHHGGAVCDGTTVADEGSINTNITLQCRVCFRGDQVQWYLDGEESPLADVDTGRLTVTVTESSGGSIYRCECGSNVECHIILVNPYFKEFGPSDSAFVRSGDTFTLVCEADGFPRPELKDYTLAKMSPPPIHFQQQQLVSTSSGVSLDVFNASKENHSGLYRCIVNTVYIMEMIQPFHGHNSASTTVTVYDPPFVRSTTNSTVGVRLSGSERPAATLECSVEEGDGEVTVRWARDGRVLHNGAKYVIPSEPIREAAGVLVYLLTVRELTEDDLGAYECQLFSNFSGSSPEAVRTVWINSQGGESESTSATVYIIAIVFLLVVIFLLIFVIVFFVARHFKTRGYNRASLRDFTDSAEQHDLEFVSSNINVENGDSAGHEPPTTSANVSTGAPPYATPPIQTGANVSTGAPPYAPPPIQTGANVSTGAPPYAPPPIQTGANVSTGAPPYAPPPIQTGADVSTGAPPYAPSPIQTGANVSTGAPPYAPPPIQTGANVSTGAPPYAPPPIQTGANVSTGAPPYAPPPIQTGANVSTGAPPYAPPPIQTGANISTGAPPYAPPPNETDANISTGAPPYALPPQTEGTPTQPGETENQNDALECLISSVFSYEEQPATEVEVMSRGAATGYNEVEQRHAGAQPENTTGGGGRRSEETPATQPPLLNTTGGGGRRGEETPQPPLRPALERSQSIASATQDPSPQSPRRVHPDSGNQGQERCRSPRKPGKRLNQSESSPLSSPRGSITHIERRRSSIKELVSSKRRGSEREESEKLLSTPEQAGTRSRSDSDEN